MSKDIPMVAIDKVEVKLTMPVDNVVLIDKIGKITGLSRAAIFNGYAQDGLKRSKVTLTKEDLERVEEIKAANRAKREELKARKGGRHV